MGRLPEYARPEVFAVDREEQTVETVDERFVQSYDDRLVATGHTVSDPIVGAEPSGAFTMHNVDAAAALRAYRTPPDDLDSAAVDSEFVDRSRVEKSAEIRPGIVGFRRGRAQSASDT